MPSTIKGKPKAPLQVRLIDGVILVITLILGAVILLTLQDPLFNIGALWIVQNIEGAIHQAYNMSALYNVWLFIGGAITLAFLIGSIEYYPKQLGEVKTRRWLLRTCVIEVILILINLVLASITAYAVY